MTQNECTLLTYLRTLKIIIVPFLKLSYNAVLRKSYGLLICN